MAGTHGHGVAFFARQGRMEFEGVEGDLAQDGEVGRSFAAAGAAGVFTHQDVEPPVQAVFDFPVGADDAGNDGGIGLTFC